MLKIAASDAARDSSNLTPDFIIDAPAGKVATTMASAAASGVTPGFWRVKEEGRRGREKGGERLREREKSELLKRLNLLFLRFSLVRSLSLSSRFKTEKPTTGNSSLLTSPARPLPPTASDVRTCRENACAFTASLSGGVPGPSLPCVLRSRRSAVPPREASPMPSVVPNEE